MFYLTGSAPDPVRKAFLRLWFAEMAIAVAVVVARPPFAVMAPVWGIGLITWWALQHATFSPRADACGTGSLPAMSDRVTEETTIAASPASVLAILLDFPRDPEWAKDLKSVEVLGTDEQDRATSVRFRAAGNGRSTHYTLGYDHSEPNVLVLVLTDGDITRKLDGRYVLEDADGHTAVTYELEVELVVPLPSFVKRRTQGKIMHVALDELKVFAERTDS